MTGFTYPKEYGGHGADAWQEAIYEEEAAGYEASSGFIRSTIMMLGPHADGVRHRGAEARAHPAPAVG